MYIKRWCNKQIILNWKYIKNKAVFIWLNAKIMYLKLAKVMIYIEDFRLILAFTGNIKY